MSTIGWVLILGALFLIRGLSQGRGVQEAWTDAADVFTAIARGDTNALTNVLARKGSTTGDAQTQAVGNTANTRTPVSGNLLNKMKELGGGKPYVFGATGPDSYDCSGLTWRAMKQLGIYNGPRFTTHTFAIQLRKKVQRVQTIQTGDILVWTAPGHMGIAESQSTFFSALSKRSGIRSLPINYRRDRPKIYRLNNLDAVDDGSSANATEQGL